MIEEKARSYNNHKALGQICGDFYRGGKAGQYVLSNIRQLEWELRGQEERGHHPPIYMDYL